MWPLTDVDGTGVNGGPCGSAAAAGRIRVLHVISGLDVGGAETFLLRLTRSLADRVEARIVSLTRDGAMVGEFRELNVPVHEFGLNRRAGRLRFPFEWSGLLREVGGWRPQIIQGWLNQGNLAAWQLRRAAAPSARLIWSVRQGMHDFELQKAGTRLALRVQGRLSRHADRIICNSERCREQITRLGFSQERLASIPNGFETGDLDLRRERRGEALEALGAEDRDFVVAMVARYHPTKDYACFLKAIELAANEIGNLRAACIGRGVATAATLRSLVSAYNLEGRCTLLEERSDLQCIFQAVDVVCLTSRSEGFPNILGEAMLSGVPCIATDVGDAATIVGDTGYVVAPRNPQVVADAIIHAYRLGREGCRRLGSQARARILQKYSMATIAGCYLEAYRELLPDEA